jgi:hypothetical protein
MLHQKLHRIQPSQVRRSYFSVFVSTPSFSSHVNAVVRNAFERPFASAFEIASSTVI